MAGSAPRSPNLAFLAILVVGGLLVVELYRVSQPAERAETTQAAPTTVVAAAHGK